MTALWDAMSREELAELGREYLMCGHLIDRSGMPQVIALLGTEAMGGMAIDEWMGASPVYTRRSRELLGIDGHDVADIFKGMQFDIGAPHHFLDFRYSITGPDHGEFFLAHCGALMDVEPMGEPFVRTMCHDIEDPTFDATACATNPRAQMRPVHRPPRVPAGREPHCRWTVDIVHDADPVVEPEITGEVARSKVGLTPLPVIEPKGTGGWDDYSGDLDPDLELESFSAPALRAILHEYCLQGHLLTRSFLLALTARTTADKTASIGHMQLTGVAGVASKRLVRHLGIGSSPADVARLLNLHPMGLPTSYVDLRAEPDGDTVVVSLHPCPALDEPDGLTWPTILAEGDGAPIEAAVHPACPTLRVETEPPAGGAAAQWRVHLDADPANERDEVAVASLSTGLDFVVSHSG